MSDRIDSLDLVRGVGIIGILFMNVMGMAAPEIAYYVPEWYPNAGWWDHGIYIAQSMLVESRFMGMFSLLFGVGLAIQADRFRSREIPVRAALRKRQAWLFIFGMLHGLLVWSGDILTAYAIAGGVVLHFTDWPRRRLFTVGIVFLVIAQFALLLAFLASLTTGENLMGVPDLPYSFAEIAALRAQWTSPPLRLALNAQAFLEMLTAIPIVIFWQNAGTMLIGMGLYRSGFFTTPPRKTVLLVFLVGGLVGAALILTGRYTVGIATSAAKSTLAMMMVPGLAMAIAYAGFLVHLSRRSHPVILALRNTGKTAFTLYITQNVVVVAVFTVLAPSLWGALGRGPLWLFVALFSLLQVLAAHYWQTIRGQGPLERLWRYLSRPRRPVA